MVIALNTELPSDAILQDKTFAQLSGAAVEPRAASVVIRPG